ncbi:MAG: hypothetical protein WDO12_02370 [Pseudomonadota bacterium]
MSARRRPPSTPGVVLEALELGEVLLDFLQHFTAHVGARGDGEDVDQAAHGGTAAPLAGLLVVVKRLVIEVIEAQEGAHPLVERLLEDEWRAARRTGGGAFGQDGFLRHRVFCINRRGK